jgi:hypothetical protein
LLHEGGVEDASLLYPRPHDVFSEVLFDGLDLG